MPACLVLNAPYFPKFSRPQRSPAVTKSGTLYYPMWLAYAAGALEQAGHAVDLVDAPAAGLDLEAVAARAARRPPRLVVIDTSTPSIGADLEAATRLKTVASGAHICLVGPHASALPEETLARGVAADSVAVGEYDDTVVDLAAALDRAVALTEVAGLVVRDGGSVRRTAVRPLIADLDRLPFVSAVYRKHLEPRHYFNPNARYPNVTLTTGRGCPFQCSFCVYPQTLMGNRYRVRSLTNVLAELEYVRSAFPEMRELFFEDDTLTGDRMRCRALCAALGERNWRLSWVANSRADLDLETLRALRAAGCRELCVGFESGSQTVLDGMDKRMTVAKERAFIRDAKRAGVLVHGCFMVGFPDEDAESLERTFRLALDLAPDSAQFYPVMVYPGTRAYKEFRERGLIETDDYRRWLTAEGLHNCVTRTSALSPADLVRFCDRARRRFYLRPRYLAYKAAQILRQPAEAGRTVKAARSFFKHLVRGSRTSPFVGA